MLINIQYFITINIYYNLYYFLSLSKFFIYIFYLFRNLCLFIILIISHFNLILFFSFYYLCQHFSFLLIYHSASTSILITIDIVNLSIIITLKFEIRIQLRLSVHLIARSLFKTIIVFLLRSLLNIMIFQFTITKLVANLLMILNTIVKLILFLIIVRFLFQNQQFSEGKQIQAYW